MSVVGRLEHMLEEMIESLFRRGFKGHAQPAEIARRLARELEENKRISISKVYVPNEFSIKLHPSDLKSLEAFLRTFSEELGEYLSGRAARERASFVGPVKLVFLENSEQRPGELSVESRFSEEPADAVPSPKATEGMRPSEPRPRENTEGQDEDGFEDTRVFPDLARGGVRRSGPEKRRGFLVVEGGRETGREYRVCGSSVRIGRRETNEICLSDPNVSRDHARIEWRDSRLVIADCASTNGTFVNGERVVEAGLGPGDLVLVGTTTLRFMTEEDGCSDL